MSGIAGIFNLDGAPADTAVLGRMLAAVAYRGPDGFGRFVAGPVAMGHAMLHSTPESLRETQPIADASGQIVLSMDGRVDNRAELTAAVAAAGLAPRDDTDAELALCAYRAWGAEAPRRMLGDFAFMVWDAAQKRLFCARDPLGVRPLLYYRDSRVFICASELHQIFADPRVPREPNEGMIGETAVQMPVNREETFFRGIMRLAPRHALMVSAEGFRIWRYYDPDPSAEIRYRKDDEYAEHFRAIFNEAIRARLRSTGRVMIDVSGGLDSSSIFCTANAMLRRGDASALVEPVSLMRHPDSDETLYVRAIERETGARVTTVEPADTDYATLEAQCRHYLDLPDYPNAAMGDYDSLLAARGDFRVHIGGNGGDEWLYGSMYSYADRLRQLKFASVARSLIGEFKLARTDPFITPVRSFFFAGLWPLAPERARVLARQWLRPDAPYTKPLTAEFARRIDLSERVRREETGPTFPTRAQRDIYRTFAAGWLTLPIELGDRWTAARGLEGRCPFFDRRILEFGLAVPEEQRMRDGVDRFVVRRAMLGCLPEEVRSRTVKATYASAFLTTLGAAGGAACYDSMETVRLGWFDGQWLAENYARSYALFRQGNPSYMMHLRPLWMGFAIELWFRNVFTGSRDAQHLSGAVACAAEG